MGCIWRLGGCVRRRLNKSATFHKSKGCVSFIPTEEATPRHLKWFRTAFPPQTGSIVHYYSELSLEFTPIHKIPKAAPWNPHPFMNLRVVSPLSSLRPLKGPEPRLCWANVASPSTSWNPHVSPEEPKIASPLRPEVCILIESRAAFMNLRPFMSMKAASPLLKNTNSRLRITPF